MKQSFRWLEVIFCHILNFATLYGTFVVYQILKKKKKIEKIQEIALRFVFCDHQSPYKELRKKAGVSTLYVDRLTTPMCEVYKVVNDIGLAYLKKYFTNFTIKDSFYETRTAMSLVLHKVRSVRYGNTSFSYEGALLWNNLKNAFKLNKSAKEFRCQILRWDGPAC